MQLVYVRCAARSRNVVSKAKATAHLIHFALDVWLLHACLQRKHCCVGLCNLRHCEHMQRLGQQPRAAMQHLWNGATHGVRNSASSKAKWTPAAITYAATQLADLV